MLKAKKKTLMLIEVIALVLFFVATVVGLGMTDAKTGAYAEESSDVSTSIADREYLKGIRANGNVSDKDKITTTDKLPTGGALISDQNGLKAFLLGDATDYAGYTAQANATQGYLTADISNFSWGGNTTHMVMKKGKTLYGNGFTITLVATGLQSEPWRELGDFTNGMADTYFTTGGNVHTHADLNGCFIGYLPESTTIRDVNFVFSGSLSGSQSTGGSGCGGIITAYSNGIIDNCSLTITGSVNLTTGSAMSVGGVSSNDNINRHSYAFGGFAGAMSKYGRISNSKIVLHGSMKLVRDGAYKFSFVGLAGKGRVRAYLGGVVGWSGNSASVYNIVTEGAGTLETDIGSYYSGDGLSFSGIVAGVSASASDTSGSSPVGSASGGIIDGVINGWTGKAKFNVANTQFSPNNDRNQSEAVSSVAGLSGNQNDKSETVRNVYYMYQPFTDTNGYTMTNTFADENIKGSKLSTSILLFDLKNQSGNVHVPVTGRYASLRFSNTTQNADVWAIYDIVDAKERILWEKSITYGSHDISTNVYTWDNPETMQYFTKAKSMDDAHEKYDVTYTAIERNQQQAVKVEYTFGSAVYMNKKYPDGSDTSDRYNIQLPAVTYGEKLQVPTIKIYGSCDSITGEVTGEVIETYLVNTFWKVTKEGEAFRYNVDDIKDIGNYETFVYMEGTEYNNIHFLDAKNRYVSYVEDDKNFKDYRDSHPGFTAIDPNTGLKSTAWQPRVHQSITKAPVAVQFNAPGDVQDGATVYDSAAVEYSASLAGLKYNETVTAELGYFKLGADSNYTKIGSAVNFGSYRVQVTGISSENYEIVGQDYTDFSIGKRPILLYNINQNIKEQDGEYTLATTYDAADQSLAYSIVLDNQQSAAGDFVIYNIFSQDISVINVKQVPAVDGGVLDLVNVGSFKTIVELADRAVVGEIADNYSISGITSYTVNIGKAAPVWKHEDQYEYIYGQMINPDVKVFGVDGVSELWASNITYFKYVDGTDDNDIYLDDWPDLASAGKYRIKYKLDGESDPAFDNYNTSETSVIIIINKRPVLVTHDPNFIRDNELPYGTEVSTTNAALHRQQAKGGILMEHYADTKVTYLFTKMHQVGQGPNGDAIWEPYGDPVERASQVGKYTTSVGIVIDGDTDGSIAANYELVEDNGFDFDIIPREVEVRIKDFERQYGDENPVFDLTNGAANAADEDRIWEYVSDKESERFIYDDQVAFVPQINAEKRSAVGDYTITFDADAEGSQTSGNVGNYVIKVTAGTLTVTKRTVTIEMSVSASEIIYGDTLPTYGWAGAADSKEILSEDIVDLGITPQCDAVETSGAGTYKVGATFDDLGNYDITVIEAEFVISPKEISLLNLKLEQSEYTYTGMPIDPDVTPEFSEGAIVYESDNLGLEYNFYNEGGFEIQPVKVGDYTAIVSGIANKNYKLVLASGQDKYPEAKITIKQKIVHVSVKDAYRIYSIKGSLTAVDDLNDMHVAAEVPFRYANENITFFEDDDVKGIISIDQFYQQVGIIPGVVEIAFEGEDVANYDIKVDNLGNLRVIGGDLKDIGDYVHLRNDSATYTGENLYNMFKVVTSNENIENALVFNIATDPEGENIVTEVVDAGTYYKIITPNLDYTVDDGEGNQVVVYTGKFVKEFTVEKAERVITENDVKAVVNYNKLTLNSKLSGIMYSLNGDAFVNKKEFAVQAEKTYTVQAKVSESKNYLESNVITLTYTTGADVGVINTRIASLSKVDFGNIAAYKDLLATIEKVGADDLASLNTAKLKTLEDSYKALISGAKDVIVGAQSVASKASGKSSAAKTVAMALSLTGGLGLAVAGVMRCVSDKKKDKKSVKLGRKQGAMILTIVLLIAVMAVGVFAGCNKKETKFSQDDLFKIASYATDSKEKNRDVSIIVKSGSLELYKYENGKETVNPILGSDVPKFNLGANGAGFTFNKSYFENAEFKDSDGVATFKADVKDVAAFLGVANATNAKVDVSVNSKDKKLNSIDVTYDISLADGTKFSVQINTTLEY